MYIAYNKTDIMKARTILILLFTTICTYIYALPSESMVIPLDSPFYDSFDTLSNALGNQVNKTRPYTYGEAGMYLAMIESESLNNQEKELFNDLMEMTKTEDNDESIMSYDWNMHLNAEVYAHTNLTFKDRVDFLNDDFSEVEFPYSNEDKFMTWDRDKPHFIDMDFSLTFDDTISLLFRLPISNTVHTGVPSGSRYLMTNIPFLASPFDFSVNSFQDFSMNFPYRANISIAGDWYSIILGREQYVFGSGESGNFIIDDALPYHNALSLSLFTEKFKYNFFISFFPHPSQYIDAEKSIGRNEYATDMVFDQNENAFTGIKMFMSHRFEWMTENNRNRFSITEGIMYQNENGILDLQVLNPMMLFHNMYIAGNSNSILQFEMDRTLSKGFNLHLAIAVDDLNIPFEDTDGSEKRPNALGLQFGVRTSHSSGGGFLKSNIEFTYMSPYFYLRDGKENSYPLDFVVAIRNQRSAAGIYDLYTIGYPNGGDQVIALLGLEYDVLDRYEIGGAIEYRLFGRNNLMTVYMKKDEEGVYTHLLKLFLSGEYEINSQMKIGGSITENIYFDYGNEKGRFENDFSVTVSYTLNI